MSVIAAEETAKILKGLPPNPLFILNRGDCRKNRTIIVLLFGVDIISPLSIRGEAS